MLGDEAVGLAVDPDIGNHGRDHAGVTSVRQSDIKLNGGLTCAGARIVPLTTKSEFRTLLETVCKHVLDDAGSPYPKDADLLKLWALAAEELHLAPHQHQETVFKTILGNYQAVVNNLGAIRNRVGDAHHGRRPVKPKPRHAELAVNLAGTIAAFLVSTWRERASE